MKMIRKGLVLFFVLLIGGLASQYPKLQIATGYAAKSLASGIFVCNRDSQSVVDHDLNYSLVRFTSSTIDYENKTVRSTFLGLSPSLAVYRPGFGCALVHTTDQSALAHQKFPSNRKDFYLDKGFELPSYDRNLSEKQRANIDESLSYAFEKMNDLDRKTASVLVVYKNQVVAERYAEGFDKTTRIWGWSMNKSIIGTMVGLLADEGKLHVSNSAPIDLWQQDDRKNIRIDDLLRMSSGLDWEEEYGKVSTATKMLYMEDNCYTSAVEVPTRNEPNDEWYYSSGSTNILSGIVRHIINNDSTYWSMPYNRIFKPIGMKSMVYETDAAGYFVGSSHGYCTTRDWARYGLLYLNNGVCNGHRIISKEWIDYSRTSTLASKGGYGVQFWLNQNNSMPDVPSDTYGCYGHRGQRVFIIPSKELVVVRLGFATKDFDFNKFLSPIVSCFPSKQF